MICTEKFRDGLAHRHTPFTAVGSVAEATFRGRRAQLCNLCYWFNLFVRARSRLFRSWLVGWLVGWFVGRPGWWVSWLVGWFVGWLLGWLVGSLAGWMVGWLVGWLVGWFLPGLTRLPEKSFLQSCEFCVII